MKKSALTIRISVARQRLTLQRGRSIEGAFPISTSRFGLGSEEGSFKTPTGRFRIAQKIGEGVPINTAFKSRVPVPVSARDLESDDLITSRILWLDGLEETNANTYNRYVYIHGTNHEELIGTPASHGCVRMRNEDVAELFARVEVGTPVVIIPPRPASALRAEGEKSVARKGGPA
ncbi:MAG: L,D-transpeptidase [Chthoniobacterales bacterium]